jgi:hypothetical protein
VPKDTADINPLLVKYSEGKLPQFNQLTERNCFFGLGKTLLEFESAVKQFEDRCEAGVTDFEALFGPLEAAKCQIEAVWSTVNLLHLVTDQLDHDRFVKLHERAELAMMTRHDSKIIHTHLQVRFYSFF